MDNAILEGNVTWVRSNLSEWGQGKEKSQLYKEEDGSIIHHVVDYYSWLPRIVASLLLSKAAVLFSTGCSRAGIQPLSFEELIGRVFIHHSTSGFQAKLHPSSSAQLFRRLCSVVGCSSGRDWNPGF